MTMGPQLIWYAAYGSNLWLHRFMRYLQGGQAEGSTIINRGCRDKTPPRAATPFSINHELYFAKVDEEWAHGGVAFILNDADTTHSTLGRKYLITLEQFTDIINQENDSDMPLLFDPGEGIEQGSVVIRKDVWYGKVLFLGMDDGYPIFSFTSEHDLVDEVNAPAVPYLTTLIKGLRETYPAMKEEDLLSYFQSKRGIAGWSIEKELSRLVSALA